MKIPLKKIQWVEFREHPISHSKNVKVDFFEIYSIGLEQSKKQPHHFNYPLYCKLLLEKVLQLNVVMLHRFLEYQCKLISRPYSWLTKLDMLLEFNADLLIDLNLAYQLNHALNVVSEKRAEYQSVPRFYRKDDFGDDNPFQFQMVKKELEKLDSYQKKKEYLLRMKKDYLQNRYNYDSVDGVDFDIQIDLELSYLQEVQSMLDEKDFSMVCHIIPIPQKSSFCSTSCYIHW